MTSIALILFKTQCQDEVRILSGGTQKLKVAKQCWKQLNEHNLMYIYHGATGDDSEEEEQGAAEVYFAAAT